MIIVLQRYDVNVVFKMGKELYVADTPSQAYQADDYMDIGEDQYEVLAVSPVCTTRLSELRDYAEKDNEYVKLLKAVNTGWPRSIENVHKDIRGLLPCSR